MVGRLKGFDFAVFGVVIMAGIYSGTKFFEPLVIEALKKEDGLRKDIDIPEYDAEGNPIGNEKSLFTLKEELKSIYEQGRKERGLDKDDK